MTNPSEMSAELLARLSHCFLAGSDREEGPFTILLGAICETRAQALEEAAKVADKYAVYRGPDDYASVEERMAEQIAEEIRALIEGKGC